MWGVEECRILSAVKRGKAPAEGSRGYFPCTLLYGVKYNVLYFTHGEDT